MATRGVKTIQGEQYPTAGITYTYSVTQWYPETPESQKDQVKWELLKKRSNGTFTTTKIIKTGRSCTFNFGQRSIGQQFKIVAYMFRPETSGGSILTVKPVNGPAQIIGLGILDSAGQLPQEPPKYGEKIILAVDTVNMIGEDITLSLWESDTISSHTHDAEENTLLWKQPVTVENTNGRIRHALVLTPDFAEKSHKSILEVLDAVTHEYYLLAETDRLQTNFFSPQQEIENTSIQEVLQVNGIDTPPPQKNSNSPNVVGEEIEGENCGQRYCIKIGDKNELIREINIRLSGFGGNVPTDEFTDRTEAMIKQFQRDYMEISPTGRVCGNTLLAIDDFWSKIQFNFEELKCPCGTCSGFGRNRGKGEYRPGRPRVEAYHQYEYPGVHRSLLWAFKASIFYLSKDSHLGFSTRRISSGYRCLTNNAINGRNSTNHCGKAIDIHYNYNGSRTRSNTHIEQIRADIFNKYLGAKWDWKTKNIFNLESTRTGATTWIHVDVREFDQEYLDDKYFVKNMSDVRGKNLIILANELGFEETCNCLNHPESANNEINTIEELSCEDKFEKIAPIILRHEGGFVNDPDDRGGVTNKGITWNTWQRYAMADLGVQPTLTNLRNITDEQAKIIYRKRYWEPKGFCKVDDEKVGLMIYDWTITSGGAGREVQRLLVNEFSQNIAIDGAIGSRTIAAINNVEDQELLLNRIGAIRKQYYTNLTFDDDGSRNNQIKFLNGWHNRVDDCLNIEL